MENPFKFGTIVDGEYFTDRTEELKYVKQVLNSSNHLVLVSPRRFGKTSLVLKAAAETKRSVLYLNMEAVTDKKNLATALLRKTFELFPLEKIKHLVRNFRMVPTLSMNAMGDGVDVSFMPKVDSDVVLEDVFDMLERISGTDRKLIVIFDEFQQVYGIDKTLDHTLRAIMQLQQNINYVLLGSQESMMREIFEKKKSPFYHFGVMMTLGKIPYADFKAYITERLSLIASNNVEGMADSILNFTNSHPYYTQKLAFHVWNVLEEKGSGTNVVEEAVRVALEVHDLDFERLWAEFNNTDKKVLKYMVAEPDKSPMLLVQEGVASSTIFSSLKRLQRSGYIIKEDGYRPDDPFFARWIKWRMC